MFKKTIFVILLSLLCSITKCEDVKFIDNYEEAISQKDKNVILVFSAEWCGACNNLKSNLKNLNLSDYIFCLIDVDKNKNLKQKYEIKSLPTSIIIYNEDILSKEIGFEKEKYNLWLKNNKKQIKKKNNKISIRVLILKHSKEQMADDDASMVISAVQKAESDLQVESIGNHFINETKKIRCCIFEYEKIENLKEFVIEKLKINQNPNDTVILFTIGHGSPNGSLHNLGQRSELQKCLAEAAEEIDQRILWWQLSCYASANLPNLESLTFKQKQIFNVLNTSNEKTPSPAYLEGKIIEKLFMAMINCDPALDMDQNEEITGLELKLFLNQIKKGRGDLLRTFNLNETIFGINSANQIQIVDHENSSQQFHRFIPIPNN